MSFTHTIGRNEAYDLIRKLLTLLENHEVYHIDINFASDGVHVEES